MQKIADLLGKPVMATATGKKLGKVKDVVLDEKAQKILAFILKDALLSTKAQVVPFSAVTSIGPDMLIVANEQAMVSSEQLPEVKASLDAKQALKGKKVVSEMGQELGKFEDLLINPATGEVTWFEASSSPLQQGKDLVVLEADKLQQAGEKAIIMAPDTSVKQEKEVLGAQPSPKEETLSDKLQQAKAQKSQVAKGWLSGVKEKAGQLKETVVEKKAEGQEKKVLGKTLSRALVDPQDTILAHPGELITHELLEKAKQAGVEDLVFSSVQK